jgi:hypothetical protein
MCLELYAERLRGPLCHLKPVLRIRPSGIPDVVNDSWGLVHLDGELHIFTAEVRQDVRESRDDATGRARFGTRPSPNGFPTLMKRIGVVGACRLTAIDAVVPTGMSTFASRCFSFTTACASSNSPLVHTTSNRRSRFSTRPASCMPCLNASTSDLSYGSEGEPRGKNPTKGRLSGCCASAAKPACPQPLRERRRAGPSLVDFVGSDQGRFDFPSAEYRRTPRGIVRLHRERDQVRPSSRRTSAAPATSARSLPCATSRVSGTIPQLVHG